MADINVLLDSILKSIYGKDVRQSIVDSIRQCYADASEGITPVITTEDAEGGVNVIITVGANTTEFFVGTAQLQAEFDEFINSQSGVRGETVLWSGTGAGKGFTATLSDNPKNYDYIEIHYQYKDYDNVLHPAEIRKYNASDFASTNGIVLNIANETTDGLLISRMNIVKQEGAVGSTEYKYKVTVAETYSISGVPVTGSYSEITSPTTDYSAGCLLKIVGLRHMADAEIADLRVGTDGAVYSSAGEAVRRQISEAKGSSLPTVTNGVLKFGGN